MHCFRFGPLPYQGSDGRRYYYSMNAQTGKIAGELPLDRLKLVRDSILSGLVVAGDRNSSDGRAAVLKRLFTAISVGFLTLTLLAAPALAEPADGRVFDHADILTEQQEEDLQATIENFQSYAMMGLCRPHRRGCRRLRSGASRSGLL